jgi:hypothetical protein
MHDHHPHGVAAPTTRRATVAAALVAAAALRPGSPADAKSSCKRRTRKSVDKTCRRMRDDCLAYYAVRCLETSEPERCRTALETCCSHLQDCDYTEHVTCVDQLR